MKKMCFVLLVIVLKEVAIRFIPNIEKCGIFVLFVTSIYATTDIVKYSAASCWSHI